MRRFIIIALWIIAVVSGGFAVYGITDYYDLMPVVRIIASLGFAGVIGFCALLCNYPTVRRAVVIVLKVIGCILAIVGGGFAAYAPMDYYDFTPLVRNITALGVAGFIGLCVLLYKYPTVRHVAIIVLQVVVGILVIGFVLIIIVALMDKFGPLLVASIIFLTGVIAANADDISKASNSAIGFLKTTNPKSAAGIIASVAALIFALAVAAIVVVAIIKIF